MRIVFSPHLTPLIIGGLIGLITGHGAYAEDARGTARLSQHTMAAASLSIPTTLSSYTLKQSTTNHVQKSLTSDDILGPRSPIPNRTEDAPHACGKSMDVVCYDYQSGRAVITSTTQWMPEIDGLIAESISLRRGRVIFSYRF